MVNALCDQLGLQPWDNQFYPEIGKQGSFILQLDGDTKTGGPTLNEDFYVDFGAKPKGPGACARDSFSWWRLDIGHLGPKTTRSRLTWLYS
jgi:hypothetical protein